MVKHLKSAIFSKSDQIFFKVKANIIKFIYKHRCVIRNPYREQAFLSYTPLHSIMILAIPGYMYVGFGFSLIKISSSSLTQLHISSVSRRFEALTCSIILCLFNETQCSLTTY